MKAIQKAFQNCEGQTVNFAGNTLPARKAFKYLTKLIRIKTNILSNLDFKAGGEAGGETSVSDFIKEKSKTLETLDINKIIKSIGENIDDEQLYNLIIDFFAGSKIDATDLDEDGFDKVFSGDLGLMLQVLTFILSMNYGGLFKKKLYSSLANIALGK